MDTLVFVAAFCLVAVLVYMARYSGRLRVTQTRIVDAPLAEVYARVSDFRRWAEWNPWLEHDPGEPGVCSGQADAVGGSYGWEGARSGGGWIEHRRLVPGERIEQRMRFRQPFRFRGKGRWQFSERDGKTEVTWSMTGRVAFPLRAFSQTVQGMVALDFRYGLDRLARLVEPPDSPCYALTYLGVREVPALRYAYGSYQGPIKGLGEAMSEGFPELLGQLGAQGVKPCGEPIAVYVKTNIKLRTTVCYMGLPVADADCGELPVREMPAHRAYVLRLQGGYAALEVAWYQAMQRMRIEDIKPDQRIPPFERYLSNAETVPENDLVTDLYIAVR
ncbi:MAG: SRPBCC family protein [Rhodocyclaceae bacterium]|nr:SRPBCC family protein [Rhodocyclaceae bacterium]